MKRKMEINIRIGTPTKTNIITLDNYSFFWILFLSGDEDSDYSNEDPKDNALS